MDILTNILAQAWRLLLESSVYVLLGLIIGGLLKAFLNPAAVARHLGRGRFSPVFKAALWGVPLPLCSCGVLPAAAALRRQGASRGATTAFLIATPESGVDSMAITYALLDPLMTLARPLAALVTATLTCLAEGLLGRDKGQAPAVTPDLSCPVDGCCDGLDCPPEEHARHHSLGQKARAGLGFALGELWGDLAGWFLAGLLVAGLIGALVPADFLGRHLGGGLPAMLWMLAAGLPLYVCATASTPIAAALVLQGVSPGAALVFLLAGPATNLASLTVLLGLLGRRSTALYLAGISLCAVALGLALDQVYAVLDLAPRALAGHAAELMPAWAQWAGALILLGLSVPPLWRGVKVRWASLRPARGVVPAPNCQSRT